MKIEKCSVLWLLLFVSICLFSGCSGDGTSVPGPGTDTKDAMEVKDEFEGKDIKDAAPEGFVEEAETVEEAEYIKEIEEDIEPETITECPGGPYCTCKKNDDCFSTFCVEGENGKVCSDICKTEENCKNGWTCTSVQTSPDTVFACIYKHPKLCKPCKENQDCESAYLSDNTEKCTDFEGNGSFCTSECEEDTDCPKGYVCSKDLSVCYPEAGDCECEEKYEGYSTECYVENEGETCYGERVCEDKILTECDAQTPSKEICDGKDNNCNDNIDEGLGGGDCENTKDDWVCKGKYICQGEQGLVCDAQIPEAEICDGIDNNCDEEIDNDPTDCVMYYKDIDGDGYGSDGKCLCEPEGDYINLKGGDCNEEDTAINPGATEVCNEIDDNCNEEIDEEGSVNCEKFYLDADADGYGVGTSFKCLCVSLAPYSATEKDDCNDEDKDINPGVQEICNCQDDNCNLETDEGFADIDGDGKKDCKDGLIYLCDDDVDGDGTINEEDCGPDNKDAYPGAAEICNGIDDDCNGTADEDCPPTSVSVIFSTAGISGESGNYKMVGAGGSTSQAGKSEGEYILHLGFFPMAVK